MSTSSLILEKRYPVLYLLDADYLIQAFPVIMGGLYWGSKTPELLIVGIGYSKLGGYDEEVRRRDYTWHKTPGYSSSGHAHKFYQIIKEEMIPFVESNYRVNSEDRAILGCSKGGRFVFYVLFKNPSLFHRYISLSGIRENILELEEEYSKNHSDLPAKLYVSIKEFESNRQIKLFPMLREKLESRNYPNLESKWEIYEKFNHTNSGGGDIARAIEMSYCKERIFYKIAELIRTHDFDYAIKEFYRIKKEESNKYLINNAEICGLGYHLLAKNKIDEAIEIFEINLKLHPNSAYDNLGLTDAYIEKGDKDKALNYVNKTIDLISDDPYEDDETKKKLKKWALEKLSKLQKEKN